MGLLWNRQILAINWHLQSSNVFFLFHSVLEFPGKWIGKIQKKVSIIFWFLVLFINIRCRHLAIICHMYFLFRMNETTVVLKRRLQFYMKGFFSWWPLYFEQFNFVFFLRIHISLNHPLSKRIYKVWQWH